METIKQKIVHLYHVDQLSIRQVAETIGWDHTRVRKALHASGHGVRSTKLALELRSSDEYREKLRQTQTGKRNHQAKLTETKVLEIRESYEKLLGTFNKSQAQYILADEYGVKRPTISDVVLRRSWKHV